MKVIINEGQRGFLFQNGKFVKMLKPGKYSTFGGKHIDVVDMDKSAINFGSVDVEVYTKDPDFCAETLEVEAKSGTTTLHFVDGVFLGTVTLGRQFFWKTYHKHTFMVIDLSSTELPSEFPTYLYDHLLLKDRIKKVEVGQSQKALLYFDNKYIKLLDTGTYYFVNGNIKVDARIVHTCPLKLEVVGQEILTADKVSLRINSVCTYKITDYVKAINQTLSYADSLYTYVQLCLREYVEGKKLDEILAGKNEFSQFLLSKLKEKESQLYIEVSEAAIKDIILPGEIRDIMNTVLIAEKRAQANVITRREEVASTRSLLNTARLMDENQTLYKLKEMEYVERICEKVGNITVNGTSDLLSQLTEVLAGKKDNK